MKRLTQEELQRKTAHYQARMNQLSEVDQNNVSFNFNPLYSSTILLILDSMKRIQ